MHMKQEKPPRVPKRNRKMKSRSKDGMKVNLPYIKGASNTVVTGKLKPYIIGNIYSYPIFLATPAVSGLFSLSAGKREDQYVVVAQAVLINKALRRLKSDDVTLKTWTGKHAAEGVYPFDAGPFYDAESLVNAQTEGARPGLNLTKKSSNKH